MVQVQMTPEEFAAKAAELKASQGIELAGISGRIDKGGASLLWNYDNRTLVVSVLKRPIFVTKEEIEGRVRKWLETPTPGNRPSEASGSGVVG